MYNQQQQNYQTSGLNYQQPSSTQSQYRGVQKQYQPAGQVQSYYQGTGQNMNQFPTSTGSQSFQNQNQNQNYQNQGQIGQQAQFASPEQFHGTNYRGDQAGHDSYLRADSVNPSQSQFGMGGQTGFQNAGQMGMNNQFGFQGQGQMAQQNQAQFAGFNPSTNQFHTANYRGNQPGHDSYLRADSTNPTQSQFGTQNQMGTQNQFGTQNQMSTQNQSPESFHTANYQGNQPGHDSYLRADSTQPSNIQQQYR